MTRPPDPSTKDGARHKIIQKIYFSKYSNKIKTTEKLRST